MNRNIKLYSLVLMLIICICGCSLIPQEVSEDFFAMDTYMSLTATGKEAQEAVTESRAFITELENLISRTNESSEIYELNHSEGEVITVSDMTYEIIEVAVRIADETEGVFDPTICVITDLWGIGSEDAHVPAAAEITEALSHVDYENIVLLGDNQVQLLNDAQIDLGGIGKGYAADAVKQIYDKYGIEHGIIALGGNVYMVGEKERNTPWNVGVVDPDEEGAYNIGIKVRDQSVVTTGGYERFFEEDGVIYHHIFDTATGYPTSQNLKSVTVVSEHSTLADLYATALFAMGYEEAVNFIASKEALQVVMIRDDDVVYVSDELQQAVTLDTKYILE